MIVFMSLEYQIPIILVEKGKRREVMGDQGKRINNEKMCVYIYIYIYKLLIFLIFLGAKQ
jgi:hypothetical protein